MLKKAWLIYFFLTIALLGATGAYCLGLPLYILGRFYQPARRVADVIMQKGIFLLMAMQPWLDADFDVQLPVKPNAKGLLVVANHRSHLDVFLILSRIQGMHLVANRALFLNPFIGPIMWAMNHIAVSKTPQGFMQAMETIRERLRAGETVVIFPELTRCEPNFAGVNGFTSAPFLVAAQEGTPIVPLVFYGTDKVWPKGELAIYSGHKIIVKTLAAITTKDTAAKDPTAKPSALNFRDRAAAEIKASLSP